MKHNRLKSNSARKTGLYLTASALIAGTLCMAPAIAQETPASGDQGDDTIQLDRVTVTAKKREQNLQDVPISITALTSDSLENAGVGTTEDLTLAVPGLNISRQLSGVAPLIRGVGNYSASPGFEGGVAVYVDEVYMPSAYGAMFSLANIERVEVLRGPQGTLFGRNATGGLIHVVTQRPSTEPSGSASLSYATQNTFEGKFYGTTGFGENVAGDIALFYRDQGDGFGTNLATGNDVLYRDEFAARSKMLFEFGSSELTISADYGESESDIGVVRRPAGNTTTIFGTSAPADFFDVNLSRDFISENEQWGVSAKYVHEFDGFEAVAVVAHRELEVFLNTDQSEDPIPFIPIDIDIEGETNSAELRFQSTGDGTVDWVVGAYYFDSEDSANPIQLSGAGVVGLTAMAPGGPFQSFSRFGTQDTTSVAVFGETVWGLDDRSNLTIGARYTEDEKDFMQQTVFVASPLSPLGGGTVVPAPAGNASATFDEPSWRISLDRRLGEDANHLVYATVSHGFKSGLFNTFDEFATAGPVEPEILDAYEAGFKSEFGNGRVRLNGAAYFYDYQDLQLTTQLQGTSVVRNVAEAELQGFELELLAALTNELDINLSAAVNDSEFKSFPAAEITVPNTGGTVCPAPPPLVFVNCSSLGDASGNALPRAPEFELTAGANYTKPTSLGDLALGLSVYHNDGSVQDFANRVSVDSYTLLNANAALTFGEIDQYTLRVFGRNITDEEYFSYITATAFGDLGAAAPGAEFGIAFDFDF